MSLGPPALPKEGSRDSGEGIVVSIMPDVCLTPCGNTMVPVPYNIWAKQEDDALTTPTVKLTSLRSHNMGSFITTCHGDEAGTGGGVKSGTHNGICEPKEHSSTVRSEGKNMIRHDDIWWMNNKNTIGKLLWMKESDRTDLTKHSQEGWTAFADTTALAPKTMSDAAPLTGLSNPGAQLAYLDTGAAAARAAALEAEAAAAEAAAAAAAARAATAAATAGEEGAAAAATSETGVGLVIFGAAALATLGYAGYQTYQAYKARQAAQQARDKAKAEAKAKEQEGAAPAGRTDANVNTSDKKNEEKCKCVVGTYAVVSAMCGAICGGQAHHIVPDFTLRTGNRAEGMAGIKRIPGMPSFRGGAAVCLQGNAGDNGSEHWEAHQADGQIEALGAVAKPMQPAGTAPIGDIMRASSDAAKKAVKADPECAAKIDGQISSSFSGVNRNALGRTTPDRWPEVGGDAYKALMNQPSHSVH